MFPEEDNALHSKPAQAQGVCEPQSDSGNRRGWENGGVTKGGAHLGCATVNSQVTPGEKSLSEAAAKLSPFQRQSSTGFCY